MYLSSVFILGLVQIWTLAAYLYSKDMPVVMTQLLKDGGLFFFATSLAATAFVTHIKTLKKQRNNADKETYWSFAFLFVIVVLCIVGFYSAVNIDPMTKTYNIVSSQKQINNQIISSIFAVIYGFSVERKAEKYFNRSY